MNLKLLKKNNASKFKFLNNKTILITGGTGSFGNAFLKNLLNKKNKIKK